MTAAKVPPRRATKASVAPGGRAPRAAKAAQRASGAARRAPAATTDAPKAPHPPMIGALLRFPREALVGRMQDALDAQGFDVTPTELGVFMYPGPDGRRPIDLARQCNMTRQAMNYVLAGLEARGYLERRDAGDAGESAVGGARVVRVTERGRRVFNLVRKVVVDAEREWGRFLGARRLEALRATLADLSRWLGKLP